MPLLILFLSMRLSAAVQRYLQTYAPSNLLIAHVRRTRPCLRVAGGLLVLATAFMFVAAILSEYAEGDGPGWLHLFVLIACWDGMKFAAMALLAILRCVASACQRVTRHRRRAATS